MARLTLWTYVKWGSLGLSVASMVAAGAMVWLAGNQIEAPKKPATPDAGTKVDKLLLVERSGEHIVWRLQADKAEQITGGGMHLIAPKLELFTQSGKAVPVSGREAWFNPLSRSVRFKGRVKVKYGMWRLSCQVLIYDGGTDEISIPGPFHLQGDKVWMRGRTLRAHRGSERLWVERGVTVEDARPAAGEKGS